MRILAVADAESRGLDPHADRSRFAGLDLIVSCGDLAPGYVDYLVTTFNAPLCYVRGNHDACYRGYELGGENLDGRVVNVGGLRVAGLEGSRWYSGRGVEYRDGAMAWRARMLSLKILLAGGVDLLVTHAPPLLDDGPTDHVHRGFEVFNRLIARHRPRCLLHGHIHLNYGRGPRERQLGRTRVVDCFGAHLIDLEGDHGIR